jgi:hypothetical protein
MTFRELFEHANDYQRERLLDLVNALRELRREIAEDHDLLASEPRLQSPRSSLNPSHVEGEE